MAFSCMFKFNIAHKRKEIIFSFTKNLIQKTKQKKTLWQDTRRGNTTAAVGLHCSGEFFVFPPGEFFPGWLVVDG